MSSVTLIIVAPLIVTLFGLILYAAWASYKERAFVVTAVALSFAWVVVSITALRLLGYVL